MGARYPGHRVARTERVGLVHDTRGPPVPAQGSKAGSKARRGLWGMHIGCGLTRQPTCGLVAQPHTPWSGL